MINAINESKKRDLENLITAFGIRHVGKKKLAKDIAKKYETLDNLMDATAFDLETKEDIGEVIASSIYDFFRQSQTIDLVKRLKLAGVNMEKKKRRRSR